MSSFEVRNYCAKKYGEGLTNKEFEKDDENNFNNVLYKKKTNLELVNKLRNKIENNPKFNYFVYYSIHSKLNSDFYYSKIKQKRNNQNYYLKYILNALTRGFFFSDFDLGKELFDKYEIKKIRGGVNLHFFAWHDFGLLGMVYFNIIFFIILLINNSNIACKNLNKKLRLIINFLSICTYFQNIFFSNLFIGITTFNTPLIFLNLIFFLFIYIKSE